MSVCEIVFDDANGRHECPRTDVEEVEVADGRSVRLCPRHRSWGPALGIPFHEPVPSFADEDPYGSCACGCGAEGTELLVCLSLPGEERLFRDEDCMARYVHARWPR